MFWVNFSFSLSWSMVWFHSFAVTFPCKKPCCNNS